MAAWRTRADVRVSLRERARGRAARDLPRTNKKTAKNRLRDAERWLRRLETNGADSEQITNAQKAVEELRREKASDEVQRKKIDKEKN